MPLSIGAFMGRLLLKLSMHQNLQSITTFLMPRFYFLIQCFLFYWFRKLELNLGGVNRKVFFKYFGNNVSNHENKKAVQVLI
jgi:hypothetical protein